MDIAPALTVAVLLWLLVLAAVLRAMAHVHRADALADRQWEELARLHSPSGIAFFPTTHARLELERTMAEAVALEPPRPRRRAARASLTRILSA